MGELLKQIEPSKGGRPAETSAGAHTSFTRTGAAERAGISKHQQVQAVRVANVLAADFERQVESPKPPTVTALAEQGKSAAPRRVVDQPRGSLSELGCRGVTLRREGLRSRPASAAG